MIRPEIKKKLINDMEKLPLDLQKKVQDFAHALASVQTKGKSGKDLLKFAGTLSDAEAHQILEVIEDGCEKVDNGEW
ncbi:MAG TPA: hypothetical protein PK926_10795 [Spirochaetota bacterium]|nr:hypothetical protein [Spirochaetota bacterium]HPI88204.1 hypothetical protein [Spirochaetota bacterium]HPR47252.1 hypothetical protein [Spirochaetota bacterium]